MPYDLNDSAIEAIDAVSDALRANGDLTGECKNMQALRDFAESISPDISISALMQAIEGDHNLTATAVDMHVQPYVAAMFTKAALLASAMSCATTARGARVLQNIYGDSLPPAVDAAIRKTLGKHFPHRYDPFDWRGRYGRTW